MGYIFKDPEPNICCTCGKSTEMEINDVFGRPVTINVPKHACLHILTRNEGGGMHINDDFDFCDLKCEAEWLRALADEACDVNQPVRA